VPAERISKKFKDISAVFEVNPLNDDLIVLRNYNAVARSIRNIIFTSPGDKPFNPFFGSRVSELLFDPIDQITTLAVKTEIEESIKNFEPRVNLVEVQVDPSHDDNEYNVIINYEIIGIDVEPQQLAFALELTR
jgi:phage baseplate assembly protein W